MHMPIDEPAVVMITEAAVAIAVSRAAAYRCRLSYPRGAPGTEAWVAERFAELPAPVPAVAARMRPDGWCPVGAVLDEIVGRLLAVWWHPATDRVRVARPRPWSDPPDPPATRPIALQGACRYRALAGYVHRHRGRPHCAPCVERVLNGADPRDGVSRLADGWTSDPWGADDGAVCAVCGSVIAAEEYGGYSGKRD